MILAALTEKKELIRFVVLVLLALVVGGYLLYSTCTFSVEEN